MTISIEKVATPPGSLLTELRTVPRPATPEEIFESLLTQPMLRKRIEDALRDSYTRGYMDGQSGRRPMGEARPQRQKQRTPFDIYKEFFGEFDPNDYWDKV